MSHNGGDMNLTASVQSGHTGPLQMESQKGHRWGKIRPKNEERRDGMF